MGRLILFSPVGGTDPTSYDNGRDGSLIHICRFYQPTDILLYMSGEILRNQEKDDRYIYFLKKLYAQRRKTIHTNSFILKHNYQECVDKLFEKSDQEGTEEGGSQIHICEIQKPDLDRVEQFDPFYDEYQGIVREVFRHVKDGDQVLFNISSGTPAMKSALMVIGTLGEFPVRMIQVATPVKGMNEHNHVDYDVELAWECDEDNDPGKVQNRCSEVHCPALLVIKNEEIIRGLVRAYDYDAALSVANSMSATYTKTYIDLLDLASKRLLFDFKEVDRLSRDAGYDSTPVKSGDTRKCFEYALSVQIKWKKKEYADFTRALTPLIADLFETVLRQFGANAGIEQYTRVRHVGDEKIREWDGLKLRGSETYQVLNDYYSQTTRSEFRCGPVYSDHLAVLIRHYATNEKVVALVDNLRMVESKVRNMAAHEIVSVTASLIKGKTGFSGDQILQMIRELFRFSNKAIKDQYWNSYDDLNQEIFRRLSSA